jgi:TonB family protein
MVRRLAVALFVALAAIGPALPASAQTKIDPPKKIKHVEPIYPKDAQAARMQGAVVIEATIGTDGKVTGAKVIKSVPLLDEAALTAVRQWEYAPTILNGVATPVIVTATVKFTLQEAAPPERTGALVLAREGGDWTVAGTPLLDDNLRFWLHGVMRTEPDKELFVRADPNARYSELIDVLASAIAAGVEKLHVFVGADPSQSVRVWLEPLAQKPAGVSLPTADVGLAVKTTATPLVVARAGTTAAAKTGISRAAAGTVVRLRIDASRKVSDIWDVLALGRARNVDGFALAVQLPAGAAAAVNAPVSPQQQQEWNRLSETLSKLVLSDKPLDEAMAESTPLLEKFVARNPNVLDAQFRLASAYEGRTLKTGVTPEAKRRDLEAAMRHLALAAAFHDNAEARFLCTWKIAQLYDADHLGDAVQAQRYAQRLTEEFPANAMSHMYYATMLHDAGDVGGAVNVLRHGRTVSTLPLIGLSTSVQYIAEQVKADRKLAPSETRRLLEEALALTDAIIASPDRTDADYQLAVMGKSIVFDLQAERVARTPQERIALLTEAERWGPPMDRHKNGVPPPPLKLSPAETRDMEWRAVGRWNAALADEGHVEEAIASFVKYSADHPDMYEPHERLANLYLEAAEKAADGTARTAALERAAAELQRVIDLMPVGPQRSQDREQRSQDRQQRSQDQRISPEQRYAFERFLDVTGPKNLNRPDLQEAAARAMLKRQPQEPSVHYALAAILFRAGKAGEAEKALRNARSTIKPTAASRAGMVSAALHMVMSDDQLPAEAARRLFDEAGSLVDEAEKLARGAEIVDVIEARMGWLYLSSQRFEKDPARAAAQKEEAKRLEERAQAIRVKAIK